MISVLMIPYGNPAGGSGLKETNLKSTSSSYQVRKVDQELRSGKKTTME
jgi:hypothetical protein